MIGATVAALYLSFCLPFWIASNRAHPATWDALLLLSAVYCLFRFRTTRRLSWAWAGCFIFAIGMTGLGTMYAILPFYGVVMLVYLVQNGLLRVRNVLLLALAFLAGLSPYVFGALQYMQSPAYAWRELDGLGQVLFYTLRGEYHDLKYSVPKIGWAIVGVVSVVPWLIVLVFRLGQNRKVAPASRIGGFILNAVLTAIGVLVALGIRIDPWRHGGPKNPLVTPYLLIAMWFGALASFWFIELIASEDGKKRRPLWQRLAGTGILAAMVASILVAAVRNFPVADGRTSRMVQVFVNRTLDSLQDRQWFISGGVLDDNLQIAAHERNRTVHVLNLAYGSSSAYLKYVASLFESPRLKGIAQAGLVPLLNEWFELQPEAAGKVAIQSAPDMWFAAGRRPLPQEVLFVAETEKKPSAEELLKSHEAAWKALKEADTGVSPLNPAYPYNRWILGHTARVANNLGVYFEDSDRADLAYSAYTQALGLDTNNLSAMLNLHSLCKRENREEAGALEQRLREILKKTDMRRVMWGLAQYYGFVRRPEAYAERGWAWAMSGKPNVGYAEMRKALEMGGNQSGVQLAMAGLYLSQEKPDQSEQNYQAVLQKNPTNVPALIGLARVAAMKRQFGTAQGHLQRLRELKVAPSVIQMEEAAIASLQGDNASVIRILTAVTKENPQHWLAWTGLALAASEANDAKMLETAMTKLAQARNLPPSTHLALSQLAVKQNDRAGARRHLEAVLRVNPASVPALENIIRLDVQERQREEAQRHIARLLALDSRNALANYVLGSLQVFNGQYALAEASYRVSMETRRSPEVLNDLAWVLSQQGKYQEALGYSTNAVALQPGNGNAWDTLGYIQLKIGDAAAAEASLQKAATLVPNHPGIMLRMAEVYEAKAMVKESLQLANQLMARASDLDQAMLDQLSALMKRLRQNEAN